MQRQQAKYNLILDSLQKLLENKKLQTISVSEIAQAAGIGKGSIYYYFPSKDAILEALVERNYEKPLTTAKNLSAQTDIPPFTRMAMIFQACRNSSTEYLKSGRESGVGAPEKALLHQKYMNHLISEFKPVLAEIIQQGIDSGEIHFSNPEAAKPLRNRSWQSPDVPGTVAFWQGHVVIPLSYRGLLLEKASR